MNAEVSFGLVGTRAGGTGSAGSSDAGPDETHVGRAQTVAASPLTVSGECPSAAHWLFLQLPHCDCLEADGDSARLADRHHLWIRAKHGRERFNGASMGVREDCDTHAC